MASDSDHLCPSALLRLKQRMQAQRQETGGGVRRSGEGGTRSEGESKVAKLKERAGERERVVSIGGGGRRGGLRAMAVVISESVPDSH